jgi:hypothetical protein
VVALDRLERLLLVRHLALWWAFALGVQTIRHGWRRRYDRPDRRDRSIVRLGLTACLDALNADHCHALPFRRLPGGWVFPGTA